MKIGIPRERKANEKRVGIIPNGVKVLSDLGHQVQVEEGAGLGSGFEDSEFANNGAKIVSNLKSLWETSDLIMKVKEPAPEECSYFREGLLIYSFLHPAGSLELTQAMLDGKITGIDYDLVQTEDGRLPILEPMSEIAGILAIQCGTQYLLSQYGGKGLLLDGLYENIPPAQVLIIGGGVSGLSAAERAHNLGAAVTILDINEFKLNSIKASFPEMQTKISTPESILAEIKKADLIVGAVLIPGAKAPRLLNRSILQQCQNKTVFVDISIDQGGISETSRATSLSDPIYFEEGVIHFCVPNMPAMVPKTATHALTSQSLPWLVEMLKNGIDSAIATNKAIRKSIVCMNGKLTNEAVAQAFAMEYITLEEN